MKARRSEINSLVSLLLYSFRNGKNLPFTIPTKTCPDLNPSKHLRKKSCRKRHSEIVVSSYDPKEKKYRLLYYGMHTSKNVYKFDQEEEIVSQIIKKSITKKIYNHKALLEVKKLKKLVKVADDEQKLKFRSFRISEKQDKSLIAKAKNRGLEVSDYIRMKLFT